MQSQDADLTSECIQKVTVELWGRRGTKDMQTIRRRIGQLLDQVADGVADEETIVVLKEYMRNLSTTALSRSQSMLQERSLQDVTELQEQLELLENVRMFWEAYEQDGDVEGHVVRGAAPGISPQDVLRISEDGGPVLLLAQLVLSRWRLEGRLPRPILDVEDEPLELRQLLRGTINDELEALISLAHGWASTPAKLAEAAGLVNRD